MKNGDFHENGEYGENGDLAKNHQRFNENSWKVAILARMANTVKMMIEQKIAKSFKEKFYEMSKGAPWKDQNEFSKFSNSWKLKIC